MTTLSWFIYLADILPSLARTTFVTSTLVAITYFGVSMVTYGAATEGGSRWCKERIEKGLIPNPVFLGFLVFFMFVAHLVPSRETLYLIVGSEFGQMAVASETGQEIINDVKEVIDLQLEKLKEN